jgi:hypothetical protein
MNLSISKIAVSFGMLGATCLMLPSSQASAAGGGYGPGAAVPVGVPGGFTSVAFAGTLPRHGGVVRVKVEGATINVVVPGGSLRFATQVAITKAYFPAVEIGLTGGLHGHRVIIAAGFVLDRQGHALRSAKPITITIHDAQFKVGDVIVEYRGGYFTPVGKVTRNGVLTITVTGVTEFAVVAP